jgi:hypothetical protein
MATDTVIISPTTSSGLKPAVSWGAVWSGAMVAVAVSILLTLAGAGLGFAMSYSVLGSRDYLTGFTPAVGAGAIVIQVLASAFGGYLAGRLRTIWHSVHDDEAHFRDMAHGLIAWALATLIMLVLGAVVLGPYADALTQGAAAQAAAGDLPPPTPEQARRAADIASQSALFMAVGLLLAAFVAAVAGRIGGLRNEHMHRQTL